MTRRPSLICLFALFAACGTADATGSRRWVRVVLDPNYEIAIDTATITPRALRMVEVWYRTNHAATRLRNGQPFNREVVRSIVRCDSLWFKVASVDMSLGDKPPISRQRSSAADLFDQPWRRIERGTSEEVAATAACHFARRKRGPRW